MRILYVTTISLTMNSFFKPHIEMLVRAGHQVEIACNDCDLPLDALYAQLGCGFHQIDFSRSPLSPDNVKAYGQLKAVIDNGNFDIVHCHTPNASVITRLAGRKFRKKTGLRVFYTAHGFHFYKGAPMLNWLVFYPVEKICSRFTDKLITINREDYRLAKEKFHAGEVCHVSGMGVEISKFHNVLVDRIAKRRELGIPEDALFLLSVGELNENKNHQIIVRALARLNNPNVHYAIAGMGDQREPLLTLAHQLGVSDRVHLLGYRTDIPELNHTADVFCFPSHREGLGLAAIEAMACGRPVITSNVHGINDYSVDGLTGYKCDPGSEEQFADAIRKMLDPENVRKMGEHNAQAVFQYDTANISAAMKRIYEIES
jgi:glycosyltransferase involved in cell wall biosynthesis